MAPERLCAPGSDLRGSQWIQTVEAEGFDALSLQHFYRTAHLDLAAFAVSPVLSSCGRAWHGKVDAT